MRIYLLAPFRTQFQLSTEYCLSDWGATCDLVDEGLSRVSLPHAMTATGPLRTAPLGFQKYDSLNSDHLGPFAQPVVTMSVPASELNGQRDRFFTPVAEAAGADVSRFTLAAVDIYVFDNTIAMAEFALDIPATAVDAAAFVAHFDLATTQAGRSFVAEVAGPAVERLARHFATTTLPGRTSGRLLTPPKSFVAFDDVNFSGDYRWPQDRSALLWVNRTMVIGPEEQDFHESAAAWGRLNGKTREALASDHYVSIRPGNNLFINDDDAHNFLPALRVVQYFYIIFDTFSDRLKRFYVNIGPWRDGRSVGQMHSRANKISSFFGFARTEFSDLMIGIQSERKEYAQKLIEAFEMDELIANVADKHVAVDAKIAGLLEVRGQTRQKVLQIGIIFIGALQIFDLLMNVSWFARSEPHLIDDGVPGIFSLGLHLSPNLIQNVAFLVVLIAAVLFANRRRL